MSHSLKSLEGVNIGLYRDDGKQNANFYNKGYIGFRDLGFRDLGFGDYTGD